VQERSWELLFKRVNTCIFFRMYQDSVTLPMGICLAKTMRPEALQKMESWSEPALQRPQGISKTWNLDWNLPRKNHKAFQKMDGVLEGAFCLSKCPTSFFICFSWYLANIMGIHQISQEKMVFFFVFFADTLCTVMPFGVGGGEGVSLNKWPLALAFVYFLEWLTLKAVPYTSCGPSLNGSPP
jgi:hypothetical protein